MVRRGSPVRVRKRASRSPCNRVHSFQGSRESRFLGTPQLRARRGSEPPPTASRQRAPRRRARTCRGSSSARGRPAGRPPRRSCLRRSGARRTSDAGRRVSPARGRARGQRAGRSACASCAIDPLSRVRHRGAGNTSASGPGRPQRIRHSARSAASGASSVTVRRCRVLVSFTRPRETARSTSSVRSPTSPQVSKSDDSVVAGRGSRPPRNRRRPGPGRSPSLRRGTGERGSVDGCRHRRSASRRRLRGTFEGRADRLRSQDRVRQGSAYPPPPCRADPAARPDRVKATRRTRPLRARRLQSAPVRRALQGQLLLHLQRLSVRVQPATTTPRAAGGHQVV